MLLRGLDEIAAELAEIRGDKDFRDTIERLVNALRMTAAGEIQSRAR
jgi:hypothetical protein